MGGNSGMQEIIRIENDIANDFKSGSSWDKENQSALFLLATNMKHMMYAIHTDGVSAGPGSGVPSGLPTESQWNACMSQSISDAGPIEIITYPFGGPGGWVLQASVNCLLK